MIWLLALSVLIVSFVAWRFWFFFRNPSRQIAACPDHILSPADGRIIYVRHVDNDGKTPILSVKGKNIFHLDELMHVDDPRLLESSGTLIGVFLSPFDVHYTRSPIQGYIEKIAHGFPRTRVFSKQNLCMFNAVSNLTLDERPFIHDCEYVGTNERASFVLKNSDITLYVTQIAERWVRRIVTYKDRTEVTQGEVFGLIRMGSQVDLYVPDGYGFAARVSEGQRVKAGITVLFTREGAGA